MKTSKSKWKLNDVRIEKIISAPLAVWHCSKLQSCAISRKTKYATMRKRQNPNFRPNLVPHNFFFIGFPSTSSSKMFQAMILCNIQENLMNQTQNNDKKPSFGPDFWAIWHKFGHQFFLRVLHLLVVRHCSKLSCYAV